MKYLSSIILVALSLSLSAQKKSKDSKVYKCRTMEWYDDKVQLEYGDEVTMIGVRVFDNETQATVQEYSFPLDLLPKNEVQKVINQYKKDLREVAKECPEKPKLSERYTDPYYYKDELLEDQPDHRYNASTLQEYNGYQIIYYETVDTVMDTPVMISHLCASLEDTEYHCRQNARLIIGDDYNDQIAVWLEDIMHKIDRQVQQDTTSLSLEEALSKRFGLENKRKKGEIEKHKIKESTGCDTYKKGDVIISKDKIVVKPCRDGSLDDIEVITADRKVTAAGHLVITGEKVKIRILRKTNLKIKIKE